VFHRQKGRLPRVSCRNMERRQVFGWQGARANAICAEAGMKGADGFCRTRQLDLATLPVAGCAGKPSPPSWQTDAHAIACAGLQRGARRIRKRAKGERNHL